MEQFGLCPIKVKTQTNSSLGAITMSEQSQLDRIEKQLEAINKQLRVLNGSVARHEQTLHGPHGRGGLEKDVKELQDNTAPTGVVNTRTMWAAVSSIAAIAAVVVALVVGLT